MKRNEFGCENCHIVHPIVKDSFRMNQWLCRLCDSVEADEIITQYVPEGAVSGRLIGSVSIRAI
jgi:hypothetical protein